jgi:hypothetical protein
MFKVCEDSLMELDKEEYLQLLMAIIPKFIQFFEHPNPKIRSAWECLSALLSPRKTLLVF